MKDFLIADDSPNKVQLMRLMLKHSKWEGNVLFAETTEDALKLIDENDVGYAFIDYYIPSKNGPSVIAYVKEKNPDAHIALTTSTDNQENFREALDAGAETCICTTYQIDEVERAFMGLLEEWRGRGMARHASTGI